MKKTYMTPAISVMAVETAAILAGSVKTTVTGARPASDDAGISDPTLNQYSKEYTFDAWED